MPKVPWNVKDTLIVFGAAWLGLPIVLTLLLSQLTAYQPIGAFMDAYARGDILANFVLALADGFASLILIRYYLRRYQTSWRALGLRRFNIIQAVGWIFLALVIFAGALALAFWLTQLIYPTFNPEQGQDNQFTNPDTVLAIRISFLALVIVPPIVEEVIFRGFIFAGMAGRMGVVPGAVISSLLFGAAHWQANISIYTFVLGLLLCLLYRRAGSIWPGVLLHGVNNYLAFMEIIAKK